jgi:hypothetical protein
MKNVGAKIKLFIPKIKTTCSGSDRSLGDQRQGLNQHSFYSSSYEVHTIWRIKTNMPVQKMHA